MWALNRAGIGQFADFARNGAQAVTYLQNCITNINPLSPVPKLVLLDIRMPLMSGFAEVLEWIRSQEELDGVPVYMLSNSHLGADSSRAKQGGATEYWTKPSDLHGYMDFAAKIKTLLDTKVDE